MAKTVDIPMPMERTVYWSARFDNRKRHCWGENIRHLDGDFDTVCNESHEDDPKIVGEIEWMRFFWAVNRIIREQKNPERGTDFSTLGGFGSPTMLGREMHDSEGNHWRGYECYPDWILFTDAETGRAKIELHNPNLVSIAKQAYKEVQDSYGSNS